MTKLFLAVSLLTLAGSSFAAPSPTTLLLQGSVSPKVSLTVTSQPVAQTLDLATTQTDLNVASVNEQSNTKSGYKVTITSANLGKLTLAGGAEVFAYTLKYGNTALNLSSAAGQVVTNSTSGVVNQSRSVTVSYTGKPAESMVEGTYSDTITFGIAAN